MSLITNENLENQSTTSEVSNETSSIHESSNSTLVRANIQQNSANNRSILQPPSKLEKFTGHSSQNPQLWLKIAKLHITFLEVPQQHQVEYIGLSLDGMPQAWFFSLPPDILNSFATFEIVFLETFVSVNRLTILAHVENCQQLVRETVLNYTVRLRTLLEPVWLQWNDSMKSFILTRGFTAKIKEFVLLKQSERPTWSETFKLAKKFESVTVRTHENLVHSFKSQVKIPQGKDTILLLQMENTSLRKKVAELEQHIVYLSKSVGSRANRNQRSVKHSTSATNKNNEIICWYCDHVGHTKRTCKLYLEDKRVKSGLDRPEVTTLDLDPEI